MLQVKNLSSPLDRLSFIRPYFVGRYSLFPPPMPKLALYIWASPWTLFGLFWGILGLVTGGRVQIVRGIIEFHGGLPAWLLRRAPLVGGAAAITFGHTVLARTLDDLDASR